MNFLSHYYFTQQTENPYYTLGTVLPDLLRNYGGSWRISPEQQAGNFQKNPDLLFLLSGWELHQRIDQLFHSSEIFSRQTSVLRKRLLPVFTRLPIRPFFLAHVGYELLLDSLLLEKKLVDADRFYALLSSCDTALISEFLRRSGIAHPAHNEQFKRFLDSFIRSAYLKSYTSAEAIVYALDRIGQRVWEVPFNEDEKLFAARSIQQYRQELSPSFREIFDYTKAQLPPALPE